MFARCTNPGSSTQSRRDNKQLMNEQNPKYHHSYSQAPLPALCSPTLQFSPTLLSHYSLRVHALISNSFHKLLPPSAPDGLIQSQSPSHISGQSPDCLSSLCPSLPRAHANPQSPQQLSKSTPHLYPRVPFNPTDHPNTLWDAQFSPCPGWG